LILTLPCLYIGFKILIKKKIDQIKELRTNLEIADKKNTDLQLKLDKSNELNQNKIIELESNYSFRLYLWLKVAVKHSLNFFFFTADKIKVP